MTPQPTAPSPIAVPCEDGALLLIEPPAGWLMAPPTPPARLILIDPNVPGPPRPSINVLAQNLGKLTPEEYVTLNRLQLKGMGENAAIERDEPLGTRAGAHLFEYVAHPGPVSVRCRQLILLHGGTAYVVTALAPAHQFEAHRARFERALNSVVVKVGGGA
jgi:hypothetical protein